MSSTPSPSIAGDLAPLSERPVSVVQVFAAQPLCTEGELLALGFAADGSLWSIEEPGLLRHWDLVHARQLAEHLLDEISPTWVFSPGCRLVASGSDELSLYEVASGQMLAAFASLPWVTTLAFSPTGHWLASGHDDGSIWLWDLDSRKVQRQLRGGTSPVSALGFSPDGKSLASADEGRVIQLWDLASGTVRLKLEGHTDRIPALAWHPSQPRLFSAGWDTTVRVWDTTTGEPIILLNSHATQVHALALSPDGSLLASSDSAQAIHLWDTQRHRTLRMWTSQGADVRALAFSPDGRRLAAGGADRMLLLKDVHRDDPGEGAGDSLGLRAGVALTSPERERGESRLYCLAPGQSLRIWETDGKSAPALQEAGALRAFALSPDGRWIAGSLAVEVPEERLKFGGTGIPSLFLWDTSSGRRVRLFDGQSPPITALAFAPDGKLLASAGYTRSDVWIWDVSSGQPVLLIPGALEGCSIEAVAFHPRGDYLAVGGIDWMATSGSDGGIALWDVANRSQVGLFGRGTTALAFHPSGERLAAASLTRSVQVWEVPGGDAIMELTGHTEAVSCVAFSPDGRWLASGCDDFKVRLWDAGTGKLSAVTPLDTQVKALCFSADSASLFTANANGTSYRLSVERMAAEGA